MHQPLGGMRGPASDIEIEARRPRSWPRASGSTASSPRRPGRSPRRSRRRQSATCG
ncbi:hypothetical protein WMF23_02260 [Sorangium sp. So ce542]